MIQNFTDDGNNYSREKKIETVEFEIDVRLIHQMASAQARIKRPESSADRRKTCVKELNSVNARSQS